MRRAPPGRLRAAIVVGMATLVSCAEPAPPEPPPRPPNLILISLDTCRPDALSLYGGPADISSHLDGLAADAVVFEHARAQAPHTAPSHMSLFTSTHPSVHGVQNVQHGKDPRTGRSLPLIEAVPEQIPTLAEVLSAAGYHTVGLTDGGNLNPAHGFPRGFDVYTHELSGITDQVDDALSRLDELAGEQPFFLFWHTYEVHAPYIAPEDYMDRWAPPAYEGIMKGRVESLEDRDFRGRFGAMRDLFWKDKERFGWPESAYLHALYKAGVAYADDQLERLIAGLRSRGLLDNSLLVVLSDHGEEFFEHGKWQHDQLYEECLRVPLVVRLPGGEGGGRRIETPVALLDVMPTVLELLDIDRDALTPTHVRMQGQSLAASVRDGTEPPARPIYSEVRSDREGGPLYDWQIAIHHNDMKLIYDEHRSSDEKGVHTRVLFDLAQDGTEQTDLAPRGGDVLDRFMDLRARYKRDLELFTDLTRRPAGEELDEDLIRQLQELGYL